MTAVCAGFREGIVAQVGLLLREWIGSGVAERMGLVCVLCRIHFGITAEIRLGLGDAAGAVLSVRSSQTQVRITAKINRRTGVSQLFFAFLGAGTTLERGVTVGR